MNWLYLKSLTLKDFGPFEGVHTVQLPKSGFFLIRGKVSETGAGSGAGKSYLLKGVSHVLGGCKDPATELQSWYTEEPPSAAVTIETAKGDVTVQRRKGLSISGEMYENVVKGKFAESELDRVFGMDEDSRAIVTYRGQRKPGLFLSLSDEKKKSFLWNLLELGTYEKIVVTAQDRAKKLQEQFLIVSAKVDHLFAAYEQGKKGLTELEQEIANLEAFDQTVLDSLQKRIEDTRAQGQSNQKESEAIKTRFAQELDAIVTVLRGKTSLIHQKKEPVEVTALKAELEKQREKLTQLKDKDNEARVEAEKQRASWQLSVNTTKNTVSRKPELLKNLAAAKYRETTLLEQKCSECKREWLGKDAETTLKSVRTAILNLEADLAIVGNAEVRLEEETRKLNGVIVPGPNPGISLCQKTISEVTEKIKTITEAFDSSKRQVLSKLDQEEKAIRNESSQNLALELQDIVKKNDTLQDALRSDLSEEKSLLGVKAQTETKNAVASERRSQVKLAKEVFDTEVAKKAGLEKDLSLEKDIMALVGRQGFLGTIVEEVLVEIAATANDILAQVANVRHLSVDFETEKVAESTGNAQARITLVVYSRGRKVSFNSGISGGMQVALELAVDLAVGDVVSRRRGSYPNWLVLDECFDGLGGPDKESCLEMLQNHSGNRLILVVDHDVSFQGLFNSVIEIEMTDGRSRVVV